ncbi:MAG TPA: hypothetical protein PLZ36_08205 [Armatimonadota bacterium]|nr:hypothetical protein [Armatimonadota bacterium]
MAVFDGIVREVYRIESWHPSGTTPYATHEMDDSWDGRREFLGSVASPWIRKRYLLKSVRAYFPASMQNPVRYVHC